MPLSEEELRLLEQMERALSEEDPKFASTLRGTSLRTTARRKAILAGVVFLGGVALLFVGVTTQWYIGLAGFLLMLGSATLVLTSFRSTRGTPAEGTVTQHPSGLTSIQGGRRNRRSRRASSHHTFMERMEERWRRRRESGGF